MRRLLLSACLILAAGASLAVGSTGAFFTDAQVSAGNVFTAGAINLEIDHSLSTYDGTSTGDLVIVSDPSTQVEGHDAVDLSFIHPAWTSIPGANWIWVTDGPANPTTQDTETFTRTFTWSGTTTSATLDFAVDNYYTVTLNGHVVGADTTEDNYSSVIEDDVTADIVQGTNTLTYAVTNLGVPGSTPESNPAGLLYKLTILGSQLFAPTNLTDQQLFDFDDVKPADQGRDVISLHNDANDAWACMEIGNIQNNSATSTGTGDLGKYLSLFLWHDLNGDGVYDPGSGETPITATPINLVSTSTLPINDSTTAGGSLPSGASEDIGSAWCAGTISVDNSTGAISCDGSTVGNESQDDSTLADITFFAEQSRNNPGFECSSLNQ